MKTFVTQSSLARRLNLPAATLALRLRTLKIEPDGAIINPSKPPGLIFDAERLTELRRAICTQPEIVAND